MEKENNYIAPEIEFVSMTETDIITASGDPIIDFSDYEGELI